MGIRNWNEFSDVDLQKMADKFRSHYQAMRDIREEMRQLGLILHVISDHGPPLLSSSFTLVPEKYVFNGEVTLVKSY